MSRSTKNHWKEAAEMTRGAPFFGSVPCVRFRHAQISAVESPVRRVFLSLTFIVLGVVTVLSVLRNPEQHGDWAIPVTVLGAFFLLGGISYVLSVRKLCIDQTNCRLYYGSVLNRKTASVPRNCILINMDTADDRGYWSSLPYGSTLLSIALRESNDNIPVINLAAHAERQPIQRLFDVLTKFMQESADNTLAEVVADNGSVAAIPRTGISRCAQEYKSASLSYTSNGNRLVIARSFTMIALWGGTFLFGLSGIVFLIITGIINSSLLAAVIFMSGFACIAGLGAIGIFPGFGSIRTCIAKEQKTILMRQGFLGTFSGKRTFDFQQIIGVQICPKYVIGDPEAGNFTVFEINFVLQRDAGIERLHIMSDRDEGTIVSYAKRLAGFIEKPIYDHRHADG